MSLNLIYLIKYPDRIIPGLARRGYCKWLSDEMFAKIVYKLKFGTRLDLKNPTTFTEKLQWLKLYDRNPRYTQWADKYAVREYIRNTIGQEYLVPLLGVWDKVEEINFDALPTQFVLKCNHDQGSVKIIKNKSVCSIQKLINFYKKKLSLNHFWGTREWPYKNIKPKLIAEQYLVDESLTELRDYKVLCFNGSPKLIELHQGRFSKHIQDFYDTEWNLTDITQKSASNHYQMSGKPVPKPKTLKKMMELSQVLATGVPHIRVDWYSVGDRLYFSELTLYDAGGFDAFSNEKLERLFGDLIELPIVTF